jgi:hypothetical protein
MKFYELSTDGTSNEWINLDLVTRVGVYLPEGAVSPQLELRLAGGGAPAPITDAKQIKEIARLLGITLSIT